VIVGQVLHYQSTIPLTIYGPGRQLDTEAVVDTGFTGFIALPLAQVSALGLTLVRYDNVVLGDGSSVAMPVYEAVVRWHGAHHTVFVLSMGYEPLVGMSLIYGSRLTLDGEDGGVLTLEELP
jgi:clan AA aspartic protease